MDLLLTPMRGAYVRVSSYSNALEIPNTTWFPGMVLRGTACVWFAGKNGVALGLVADSGITGDGLVHCMGSCVRWYVWIPGADFIGGDLRAESCGREEGGRVRTVFSSPAEVDFTPQRTPTRRPRQPPTACCSARRS